MGPIEQLKVVVTANLWEGLLQETRVRRGSVGPLNLQAHSRATPSTPL